MAVIHCRGHQKDNSEISRGNHLADQTARDIAKRPVGPPEVLILQKDATPPSPHYTSEEEELGQKLQGTKNEGGWVRLPDGRIFLLQALGRKIVEQTHQNTHLGGTKLAELLQKSYFLKGLYKLTQDIAQRCQTCARVNPNLIQVREPGVRFRVSTPGEHWELDFTGLPVVRGG